MRHTVSSFNKIHSTVSALGYSKNLVTRNNALDYWANGLLSGNGISD